MQERYEELRKMYNSYSYTKLKDTANSLCNQVHAGKSFIEVYGNDNLSAEDLINDIVRMHRRVDLQEMNRKVIEEREVLNKPVTTTQIQLGIVPDTTTTLMDLWREKWDMRIVHQDVPRDLYFLALVSQLFKNITIFKGVDEDMRIHVCLIMPSGTGKSDGNDILTEVAELTGLSSYYLDRYTDAVLTGSIDQKKVERNTKTKSNPGDPEYLDPVVPSVLVTYDIIVYDEGENILKTNTATEGAQRILQKAMNRHGSAANKITNSLVGGNVEGYPNCSVIITSYFLEQFKETLLRRGLLQRMIVFITEENENQRTDIINRIVDAVPTFKHNVAEAEMKKNIRITRNQEINKLILAEVDSLREFHQNTESIYIHESAAPVIKEIIAELREILPLASGQREVWNSMISRLTVNILKMSALFAIINYRTHITEHDVRQSAQILIKTMDSVGFFLKKNMKTFDNTMAMAYYKSLVKSDKIGMQMSEKDMTEFIATRFGITRDKAKMVIDVLISQNKIAAVTLSDGTRKVKIVK